MWDPANGEFYFLRHKTEESYVTQSDAYDCLCSVCPRAYFSKLALKKICDKLRSLSRGNRADLCLQVEEGLLFSGTYWLDPLGRFQRASVVFNGPVCPGN